MQNNFRFGLDSPQLKILKWSLVAAALGAQLAEAQSIGDGAEYSARCNQLRFVSRRQWGAREPEEASQPLPYTPTRVFVHQAWDGRTCYDIDSCSIRLQAMQAFHQHTKGWPDISYNFLISGDGSVYEGRGFRSVGFHTLNYNQESLGVALIGTFQEVRPPSEMFGALEALIGCALDTGKLAAGYRLHGHRDARCTICPGDAAYARLAELARFEPGPLPLYSCPRVAAAAKAAEAPELRLAGNSSAGPAEGRAEAARAASLVQNGDQMKTINVNSNNKLLAVALHTNANGAEPQVTTLQPIDLVEEAFVGVVRRRLSSGLSGGRQRKRQTYLAGKERSRSEPYLKEAINRSAADNRVVLVNAADGATVQPSFYVLTNGRTAPGAIIITGGGGSGGAGTARPASSTPRPASSTPRAATAATTARPAATTARPAATTRPPAAGSTPRPANATTRSPAAMGVSGLESEAGEPTQVGSLLSRLLSMSFFGDITLF